MRNNINKEKLIGLLGAPLYVGFLALVSNLFGFGIAIYVFLGTMLLNAYLFRRRKSE